MNNTGDKKPNRAVLAAWALVVFAVVGGILLVVGITSGGDSDTRRAPTGADSVAMAPAASAVARL